MWNRSIRRRIVLLLIPLVLLGARTVLSATQAAPSAVPSVPDTPEAHLGKGYDALKQDRYEEAVTEFDAALRLDPGLTLRARFPLAVALFELHHSEESRREFDIVRKEVGDHPNVLYYLGRLDVEERNFESAIRNLKTAAAAKPKAPFPDTAYYLGFAYFKHGDLTVAEKWLKEAAQLTPSDARVLYQLGFVYRKEGREEEAKKALAASDELRRRDDDDIKQRAECGRKLDQSPGEEARTFCEQLYAPNDADKLTALGTLYGQHGDLEAALKPFRRAAELSPKSPQMQYNLALTYYQLGRFRDASAALAPIVEQWPDVFQLNALYGAVLLKLGDEATAYPTLQHAQQLNPQDARNTDLLYKLLLSLAHRHQETRDYPTSLRYLGEAAKLRTGEPEPHRSLAEIYTLTGNPEQAASELREADRLTRNLPK
jgi:Flp pilus assembly protein TadD